MQDPHILDVGNGNYFLNESSSAPVGERQLLIIDD